MYAYGYGYPIGNGNPNTLLAASYLQSLKNRAASGSGTMVDEFATLGLYNTLIDVGLITSLRRGYSDLAAVRINDVAGTLFVQERFDLNDGTLGGASSSVNAVQSTAANQAGWTVDADTGRRQTTYDGSNDVHTIADLALFRNQPAGCIFAIVKDAAPTSGDAGHTLSLISRGGALGPRLALYSRGGGNNFYIESIRVDGGATSVRSSANGTGYNTLASIATWGGNALVLYYNGTETAATTFASGAGVTSDTDSFQAPSIGAVNTTTNRLSGQLSEILFFRTSPSVAQLNALRNFYRRYYPTLP
jgi:hypothetical protein